MEKAQAIWKSAAAFAVATGVALSVGGCAHAPRLSGGEDARGRLIETLGGTPIRGVGDIKAEVGDRSGTFEARWGSSGDSLVLIGYAGPARVLDASLLRDSLYLGMRRDDFAATGRVRPTEGIGADWLRFLFQPWDFGHDWIRRALEAPSMSESGQDGGWVVGGEIAGESGKIRFTLTRDEKGEPRRLELRRGGEREALAVVRYGALRRYAAGRYPRWVEWERERTKVRLDVREVDALPEGRLRVLPPPPGDWRVVALDNPDGRKLLDRLLGREPTGDGKRPPASGDSE